MKCRELRLSIKKIPPLILVPNPSHEVGLEIPLDRFDLYARAIIAGVRARSGVICVLKSLQMKEEKK